MKYRKAIIIYVIIIIILMMNNVVRKVFLLAGRKRKKSATSNYLISTGNKCSEVRLSYAWNPDDVTSRGHRYKRVS